MEFDEQQREELEAFFRRAFWLQMMAVFVPLVLFLLTLAIAAS
jgi:hypothetical protein